MPTDGEGLPSNVNVGGTDAILMDYSRSGADDERRRIVAYLRQQAKAMRRSFDQVLVERLASDIEDRRY